MVLSLLGRANLENRWRHFLNDGGKELVEVMRNNPPDSTAYEDALKQTLAKLNTSVEVDYPVASKRSFIEEKVGAEIGSPPR